MEKKNSEGMSTAGKVAMGAGIAALAAAAAGAVFLYGTDSGKAKRKQLKSWSLKMRADVMDKMEGMKEWSESAYHNVVDAVGDKYKNLKNVDAADVALLVADLKKHWNTLRKQVEGTKKKKPAAKKKTA